MANPENKLNNPHSRPKLFSGMRNNHDYPGVIGKDWEFDAGTNSYVFTGSEIEDNQLQKETTTSATHEKYCRPIMPNKIRALLPY